MAQTLISARDFQNWFLAIVNRLVAAMLEPRCLTKTRVTHAYMLFHVVLVTGVIQVAAAPVHALLHL